MSNFGKMINDYEDGIISFLGFWKASDEVHTDFIPFPLGDRQRSKSTSRSLMFCLNATTNITFSNKLSNFSLHPSPPKYLAYILIHFSTTAMNREGRFMGFSKDQLSKVLIL